MPRPVPDLAVSSGNQNFLQKIQEYIRRELDDPSTSGIKRQLLSFILDIMPGQHALALPANPHDRCISYAQDSSTSRDCAPTRSASSPEFSPAAMKNPPIVLGYTPSSLTYTPLDRTLEAQIHYEPPDLGFSPPSPDSLPSAPDYSFLLPEDFDDDDDEEDDV